MSYKYQAILFDLLSGLMDSWTVWDRAAGSEQAGRRWRGEYLRLVQDCGTYRPYDTLVTEAARNTGLDDGATRRLEQAWATLTPWPGVTEYLAPLSRTHRLGVVTNCSEPLGRAAAARTGLPFEVVVTSERVGYYKPHPRPYEVALQEFGLPASRVLYVCGSGTDLFGTAATGLDTYWHNRIGLASPAGAPPALREQRDLAGVPAMAMTEA